jgi:hypothetical protein
MRRRLQALPLLLALAIGWTVPAIAEPGPVVRRLMETPATLFSLGLVRLQLALEAIASGYRGDGTLVLLSSYDWDANRIVIEADLAHPQPSRELCAEVLGFLRGRARVHPREDGRYLAEWMDGSAFSSLFGHVGFTEPGFPADIARRLDEIVVLRAHLAPAGQGLPQDPVLSCESRLMRPSEIRHEDR